MLGNGRADDRRRRVLTEELIAGAADDASNETSARAAGSPSKNRYGEAARMTRQPRITDFVPRHYGWIALLVFGGAALVAGIEAGYYYLPLLGQYSASGRIAALDLAAKGSLASWLTTTLLTAAAFTAWIVYGVRKHRADDYHGRYRIWFAAALAWFYLGVDESASLHEAIRDVAVGLSGQVGLGAGSVWWLGAYTVVFGFVGVRLALEMRECRTSTTIFLLAGLVYLTAAVQLINGELHWFTLPPGVDALMLERGLILSAALLLVAAHLVHARYVVLEAAGEITARPAKPKKEKAPKAAKPAKEAVAKAAAKEKQGADDEAAPRGGLFGWMRKAKIDPPHPVPAPARKSSDLAPAVKSSSQVPSSAFKEVADERPLSSKVKRVQADFSESDDYEDDEPREGRKLSKADRKAMRKHKEMERRGYGE